MEQRTKLTVKIVAAVVIAILSFFIIANIASSAEFHAKSLSALDEKKETVMELAAASVTASIAIAAVPGDATTPVATTLAEFSKYFTIILATIVLEKYLLTLTGLAAFKILIPIACILYAMYFAWSKDVLKAIANKLVVLALVIFLVVPISVQIAGFIDQAYADSIENTKQCVEEIQEEVGDVEEDTSGSGGLLGFLTDAKNQLTGSVSAIKEKLETVVGNFIESIAVMVITSCVIPIVVLLFLVFLIKSFLLSSVENGGRATAEYVSAPFRKRNS